MEANDALLTLRPCIPPWLLPSPPCSLPFKLKTARISEYCSNGRCIIIGPRSQYKIRSYPIHSCVCTFASHSSRSSTTPAMAKPQLASAKSPVRTSRRGTSVQMLGLSSCSWTTDLSHGIFWIRREEEEQQQQQEEVGSQVGEAGRLSTSLILFF